MKLFKYFCYDRKARLCIFSLLLLWFMLAINKDLLSQDWIVVRKGIGINIDGFGFSQIYFPDANNGWAVSFQDPWGDPSEVSLIYTKDGGITWREKVLKNEELVGIDYKPLSVYFLNSQEGWIGGADSKCEKIGEEWKCISGVIMHTRNNGLNWDALTNLPDNVLDIDFVDSQNGWAITSVSWALSYIHRTTDGGHSWSDQNLPDSVQDKLKGRSLRALSFSNDQNGWAVGSLGVIVQTKDGRIHWTEESSPVDIEFMDVQYVPGNGVFVLGNDGTILKLSLDNITSVASQGKISTTWGKLKKETIR